MSEREQGFPKWSSLRSIPTKGSSSRILGLIRHDFDDLDNIEIISKPLKDLDGWTCEQIKEYSEIEIVEVSKQTQLNDSENYHYLNACDFYFECDGTFRCIGIKMPKQS